MQEIHTKERVDMKSLFLLLLSRLQTEKLCDLQMLSDVLPQNGNHMCFEEMNLRSLDADHKMSPSSFE